MKAPITTRLQKGGALIGEMRQLVMATARDPRTPQSVDFARKVLTKATGARLNDVLVRAFRPRFVNGSPPEAWRVVAAVESHAPDPSIIIPLYYWITARSEPLLYSFVIDELWSRLNSSDREIRMSEVTTWISGQLSISGKSWSPTVSLKVARGLLAALRDFGLLEGKARKRMASFRLAPEAFALIAFLLRDLGSDGSRLVGNTDWRLFLLSETAVERMFIECNQHHWLRYEVAGAIHRIEFPSNTFDEYVHELLG